MYNKEKKTESYEIIDESEVPERSERSSKYKRMFERIPKGKALVLSEEEVSLMGLRAALKKFQRRGLFKNLRATQRTIDGKVKLYIINSTGRLS